MNPSEGLSRVWEAFDTGELVPACAWCGRIRIDRTWLVPPPAALAAVDRRFAFSHSICDACVDALGNAADPRPLQPAGGAR
jgi:hypothetical protein